MMQRVTPDIFLCSEHKLMSRRDQTEVVWLSLDDRQVSMSFEGKEDRTEDDLQNLETIQEKFPHTILVE
jgi:hypothetical protein